MNQAGGGGRASPVRELHLSQAWPQSTYERNERRDVVAFTRSKKRADPSGIIK